MGDFELEVQGVAAPLLVRSFIGDERLHRPHTFRIVATTEAGMEEAAIAALLDAPATLRFQGHEEARRVGGVLSEVALLERTDGGRAVVELRLTSRLARLGARRTSRIHQDATVPEILARILDLHGIPHAIDVARTHARRETSAQYRETDLAFITRLCAEEHIAFHVTDAGKDHEETVVFCDAVEAFKTIQGPPELTAPAGQVGDDALGVSEDQARVRDVRRRTGTGSVLVRRHDPMRPLAELRSAARWSTTAEGVGRVAVLEAFPEAADDRGLLYEHHADLDDVDVAREDAARMLAQRRRRALEIAGDSPCVRLAPGRRFTLGGAGWTAAAGELLLTRVQHHFRNEGLPGKKARYEAVFRAVPAGVFPHPRAPSRKPVEVVQTGVVVGPPGEEIFTDEHGRVRVQLHWDLDGKKGAEASAWIRVAQAWAGNGFGSMFVPRVGMEVLVSFLGGDPDRPVVIGCLHHAAHPPPFALPAARAVSGVVSRSTPGGDGSSELSIDDRKGSELVRARSERDLELQSSNDTRLEVGSDRQTRVGGDDTLIVTGSRTVRITGGLDVEVAGDAQSLSLGDVVSTHMGKHATNFEDVASVHYGAGLATTSTGPVSVHVEAEASLVIGTGDTQGSVSVDGDLVAAASRKLILRAEGSITLQVGTTVLEVTADGIRLDGKTLALKGETITAEGDGPKLSLSDEIELLSQKVTILSKKAGLILAEDAKLWGKPLALNPPPEEKKVEAGEEKPKTKPFKVKLTDPAMEPYGGKRWVLFASGARQEGETASDGAIDVEIPEAATQVDVTCWLDEYPTGRQRTWTIAVEELPPAKSLKGCLLRLHNLGYWHGKIPEVAGPSEKAALRWFQQDHDMEITGELDAHTASELESVHGS